MHCIADGMFRIEQHQAQNHNDFFYDVSLYSAAEIKCEMIIIHWPIIKCKLGVRCASFTLPDDGVLASAR